MGADFWTPARLIIWHKKTASAQGLNPQPCGPAAESTAVTPCARTSSPGDDTSARAGHLVETASGVPGGPKLPGSGLLYLLRVPRYQKATNAIGWLPAFDPGPESLPRTLGHLPSAQLPDSPSGALDPSRLCLTPHITYLPGPRGRSPPLQNSPNDSKGPIANGPVGLDLLLAVGGGDGMLRVVRVVGLRSGTSGGPLHQAHRHGDPSVAAGPHNSH